MRICPHGLRISSWNLNPLPFWRVGAQIVALNRQKYDLGMELNGALFSRSAGWILKPEHLRSALAEGAALDDRRRRGMVERSLWLQLFGACGLPDVADIGPKKAMQAYVKAEICSSQGKKRHRTKISRYGPRPRLQRNGRKPVVWRELGVPEASAPGVCFPISVAPVDGSPLVDRHRLFIHTSQGYSKVVVILTTVVFANMISFEH